MMMMMMMMMMMTNDPIGMYTYTPFVEHFMVHVIDVNVGSIPYMDAMGTDDDSDRPSREPVHISPGEKENHRERCLGRAILVPRKALLCSTLIMTGSDLRGEGPTYKFQK